ncbi:MAG: glycosyltransferase [bacterium]|nr:glycosyltransferase [bacterium]
MKTDKEKVIIGADGGDYVPGDEVKNGIQRLVSSFIYEYSKQSKKSLLYYFYFGRNVEYKGVQAVSLPKPLFGSSFMPVNVIEKKCDIFLGFSGYIPSLLNASHCKKILFIHDFAFLKYPEAYRNQKRLAAQTISSLQRADLIIVFSDYIQKEVCEKLPEIDQSRIKRIYAGGDHLLRYERKDSFKGNYFLYVGIIKPIKQIEYIFELFASYKEKTKDSEKELILIGKKEKKYMKELEKNPHYVAYKKSIRWVDHVSDTELATYYEGATAVLNVSKDEGFCYPVIEALTMGAQVLVNDLPLYHEYAAYFPNLYIGNSEQLIKKMMKPPPHSISASSTYDIFTWKSFTEELLEVIEQLA